MMKKCAAALAALAVLSAAPLLAQPETQAPAQTRQNRIPVEDMRSYGATATVHNARLLGEVLRDFGYDADRLSAGQQERLDDARYRLFPDQSPRQRLNRTQAIAVVYTALVYPRGTGGRGGWDDDRGRDRPDDAGRCVAIDEGVYELLNLVSGDGNFGSVDDEEKVKIHAVATRVQGAAIARNYRQVADRAVSVMASVSEWSPRRTVVRAHVNALKTAVDQACGDDGRR
jgi:hypothetical protein